MDVRIEHLRRYGATWRRLDKRKLVATYLHQTFVHTSGASFVVEQLCPWGMRETVGKLLLNERCLNANVLPVQLIEEFPDLTKKGIYNKKDWRLEIKNTGPADPSMHYRLFCNHCQYVLIPKVIDEFRGSLGENPTVDTLIANWDALKIPVKYIDYIGCFLPWKKSVKAGPCSRKYIRDQSEHPKTSHPYTVQKLVNPKRKASELAPSAPPKTISLTAPEPTSSKQSTITGKQKKKTTVITKQSLLDDYLSVIPLVGKCTKSSHDLAKGFCLSMVHTGVNKTLSQCAIIDMYRSGYQGMLSYYEHTSNQLKVSHPGVNLPPPVKVSLNEHNIIQAQKAILDGYRFDKPDSLYRQMQNSPFYSIMHDGIAKFGAEFNGVYLRGINAEHEPFCVPFCLNKMKGGVTGVDTANELVSNVASFISLEGSAFHTVAESLRENAVVTPDVDPAPPNYFKIGKLSSVDPEAKVITIDVDGNFLVANMGDGVAVNIKAARILRDLYGFYSPDFRCAAHASSGTIKRLATSKTMNVQEVTVLYECLRTVIKHFESSIKNKELLDEAMEILEMTPLHLLSWCQTRMAHFRTSCKVFDDMLAAVYDAMFTKNIRVDERDLLFTAINIFIVKVIADLQPKFVGSFLRKCDKTDLLVTTVYNCTDSFAKEMSTLQTPGADAFKQSLKLDENGNLHGSTKVKDHSHTMLLNHPHKPTRRMTEEERLEKIKAELDSLKKRIIDNMSQNIKDQCRDDTYFYCWSGLDLDLNLSFTERKNRLRDLITVFCTERIHTVQRYTDSPQDTKTDTDTWEGYEVHLHYPAKILVLETEFMEELDAALKTVNGLYLKEVNAARCRGEKPKQINIWKEFLSCHFLEFRNVGQLVQIMIATAPNTSPLERGYTHLQMVTSKRRNRIDPKNLEVLFLLATLKIPYKKPDNYTHEIIRLQGK